MHLSKALLFQEQAVIIGLSSLIEKDGARDTTVPSSRFVAEMTSVNLVG